MMSLAAPIFSVFDSSPAGAAEASDPPCAAVPDSAGTLLGPVCPEPLQPLSNIVQASAAASALLILVFLIILSPPSLFRLHVLIERSFD